MTRHEIEDILSQMGAKTLRQQHADELKQFDACELSNWDDKELAKWQSRFKTDEPQWILTDHEWKRRAGIATRKNCNSQAGIAKRPSPNSRKYALGKI